MSVDLLYTDIEEAPAVQRRRSAGRRSGPTRVLATIESDQPCDLALWETLGGLGVTALLIPEKFGGSAVPTRRPRVVAEELGTRGGAVPFLGAPSWPPRPLVACAAADPLAALADRDLIAALAVPLASMPGDGVPGHRPGHVGWPYQRPRPTWPTRPWPDCLWCRRSGPGGPRCTRYRTSPRRPVTALDRTRASPMSPHSPGTLLAGPDLAPAILDEALTTGAGCWRPNSSVWRSGVWTRPCVNVKERYQFGRPVGSFQALKHRLADVWLELVTARAAARYAADALASASDVAVAVSVAAGVLLAGGRARGRRSRAVARRHRP